MLTDNLTGYSRYYAFTKTPNTRMIISKIKEWCLDFGYMSHFWSDGAGNFTSDEMKRFYVDNKILHRQGAGEHSEAQGRVEERIGFWKALRAKTEAEGKSEGDHREVWELAMMVPQEPGELSPARMAFFREKRHPSLISLPQPTGGEASAAAEAWDRREHNKVRRNDRLSKFSRRPVNLVAGSRVFVLSKSGKFDIPGKVGQVREGGRSAAVHLESGRTITRNRRNIVLDLSEPQPNEQVNCVIEKETYWKVTWTRTPEGDTPEVTKHLTPVLKSCLKTASPLTKAEKPDTQHSTQPAESGKHTVTLRLSDCRHSTEVKGTCCEGVRTTPGTGGPVCCCSGTDKHQLKC